MKKVITVFILFFVIAICFCQSPNFFVSTEELGEKGLVRVELKNGQLEELKNAKIEKPYLNGLSNDGKETEINTSDIYQLQITNGHHGFTMGLIGEFILGTIVGVATIEEETDGYVTEVKINYPAMLMGCAAGFGIGYLLGSTSYRWTTVYDSSDYGLNENILPVEFTSWQSGEKLYAGISYRFK